MPASKTPSPIVDQMLAYHRKQIDECKLAATAAKSKSEADLKLREAKTHAASLSMFETMLASWARSNPVATSQVILFMDVRGGFHAEGPGKNGQRAKIDLPPDFGQRNPELLIELTHQRDHDRPQALSPSAGDLSRRRDAEKALRKAEQAAALIETQRKHWESLTEAQQNEILAKREIAAEKRRERELETAHSVWNRTATRMGQGIDLANRIIDDPRRRPKSAAKLTREAHGQSTPRRAKKLDMTKVIDI